MAETTDPLLLGLREAANVAPQHIAATLEEARDAIITLRTRLATAEAERDQWKEAAESTLREIDRITERMEGRRAAVEAMTPRRAPSTGGTP